MIVDELIKRYELTAHPEGGWYKQTYQSNESIPLEALPERFSGARSFATAIYFLLEQGNFSAFHRIRSDETWHFYKGEPLEIFMLHNNGKLETVLLGDMVNGTFQFTVPANTWFASRPAPLSSFCFTGCTVSPGFDFADFELAHAEHLITEFPSHEKLIRELCRQ